MLIHTIRTHIGLIIHELSLEVGYKIDLISFRIPLIWHHTLDSSAELVISITDNTPVRFRSKVRPVRVSSSSLVLL